jgi:hypothetical protein
MIATIHVCTCGNETSLPITTHPVSGRKLPIPICRECAEKMVREPYNDQRLKDPPVRRRMVKVIGDV